jgi:hypothetical protein
MDGPRRYMSRGAQNAYRLIARGRGWELPAMGPSAFAESMIGLLIGNERTVWPLLLCLRM